MAHLPSKARKPIRVACQALGGKWELEVLGELQRGPLRFSEIRRHLPCIPPKSLGRALRKLEQDGFIRRSINAGRPPQVIYAMLQDDVLLRQIIESLERWGERRTKQLAAGHQGTDP